MQLYIKADDAGSKKLIPKVKDSASNFKGDSLIYRWRIGN
jgi:hypothetical protein